MHSQLLLIFFAFFLMYFTEDWAYFFLFYSLWIYFIMHKTLLSAQEIRNLNDFFIFSGRMLPFGGGKIELREWKANIDFFPSMKLLRDMAIVKLNWNCS